MYNKNEFRSVATFWYKNTHYHMFINGKNKVAYLIINKDGDYEYPTLKQLLEVNAVIHSPRPEMIQGIIRDEIKQPGKKPKKVKFVPKVIIGGVAVLLTANMLGKIGNVRSERDTRPTREETRVEQTVETSAHTEDLTDSEISDLVAQYDNQEISTNYTNSYDSEYDSTFGDLAAEYDSSGPVSESGKPVFTYDPTSYMKFLADADDVYDYAYASDYRNTGSYINISDSNGFKSYFGYDKPTYNDLVSVINSNSNLSPKYKDFIKDYLNDWLTMWPDSDFSVFYYNLQTLKIEECTPEEIQMKALSSATVACYQEAQNTIYVRNDINLEDKTSNDYIVMAHELTHPARTLREKDGRTHYNFMTFNPEIPYCAGCYYDEAVITNLIYEMQGLNNKSIYYTVPSSYYRIIMDCVGYDGNEYMNRSINYMADKMDQFMGDEYYAYYIMQLIGYNYQLKMGQYVSVDVESFEPLYDYITRMYMKKYLQPGMTADEAEEVFTNFTNEMSWNIENLAVEYAEQDPETFRPSFEKCCEDLGISLGLSR